MATMSDKAVGGLMVMAAFLVFSYYTVWVIVLPFVEKNHSLHLYFLPWWWAVMLPTSALLLLLLFIGTFVGVVITQDSSRRTKSHNE